MAQFASPNHEAKSGMAAQEIMVRLCFSKNMIRQVVRLVQEQAALADYDSSWSDGDLRRFIRRVGAEHMEALITVRRAGLLASGRRGHQPLRQLDEIQRRMRVVMKTRLVRGRRTWPSVALRSWKHWASSRARGRQNSQTSY